MSITKIITLDNSLSFPQPRVICMYNELTEVVGETWCYDTSHFSSQCQLNGYKVGNTL